jgi:hypothetical protein
VGGKRENWRFGGLKKIVGVAGFERMDFYKEYCALLCVSRLPKFPLFRNLLRRTTIAQFVARLPAPLLPKRSVIKPGARRNEISSTAEKNRR